MRRIQKAVAWTVVALALATGVARAEQRLGVDVYKKAELLPAKTAYVKQTTGVDASCYRTADSFNQVRAFYSKMSGFSSPEPNVLRRANVDVVLHPPAADPRTGVVGRYTVFCIMQTTG